MRYSSRVTQILTIFLAVLIMFMLGPTPTPPLVPAGHATRLSSQYPPMAAHTPVSTPLLTSQKADLAARQSRFRKTLAPRTPGPCQVANPSIKWSTRSPPMCCGTTSALWTDRRSMVSIGVCSQAVRVRSWSARLVIRRLSAIGIGPRVGWS